MRGPFVQDGLWLRDAEGKTVAYMGWGRQRGMSMRISIASAQELREVVLAALNARWEKVQEQEARDSRRKSGKGVR